MKMLKRILAALAVGGIGACASASPYYYDPYYGYSTYAYDDYYYDATMASGYYYYPSAYYYSYQTKAASVSLVPPSVRLLLERWGAPIDPTCLTVATAAGDNDKDGIDANSTITFQCNSEASGRTAQVSGSVNILDLDDAAADAGFTITFNGFKVRVVSATGALTERLVNGTETAQKIPSGLRIIRDVVVNGTDTFPDGVERQAKFEAKSQGLLTPDVVAGSAQVTSGTMLLSGTNTFTAADGVPISITRTTDPTLHWNNECTKIAGNKGPYDSGAMLYRSSQGRQTRIVHESCTTTTVTNTTSQ